MLSQESHPTAATKSVTHDGCEYGSVSHMSQNKTQFMYNVYYKLNDAIHTNNVQLFTHSSMRENYIITILDLYPLTFRLHAWHINLLVCKALNKGVLGASLLLYHSPTPTAWHWPEQNTHHNPNYNTRNPPRSVITQFTSESTLIIVYTHLVLLVHSLVSH